MNVTFCRIIALTMVLVLSYAALGDAPLADEIPARPVPSSSCCVPLENGDELPGLPCSNSDCVCLSCMLCLDLPPVPAQDFAALPLLFTTPYLHYLISPQHVFGRAIDYPPEHS